MGRVRKHRPVWLEEKHARKRIGIEHQQKRRKAVEYTKKKTRSEPWGQKARRVRPEGGEQKGEKLTKKKDQMKEVKTRQKTRAAVQGTWQPIGTRDNNKGGG